MSTEAATIKPVYNLKNPCIARLKSACVLTGPGAAKDTRHYEIDLCGSGMEFVPGDSLAVQPRNDPALADAILEALGFSGAESVPHPKGGQAPLKDVLMEACSLTEFDGKLLKAVA